eukprot:TRINITY_DN3548_c0_g1_i1.p1 TRINITY_DN3548_c0_g1~~TRINITY_DN3548_c0_g1_i1.p1  ORF type:complete len:2433 (+),score=476.07 TRINITY_DN3548_c0_g1_i1:124-7299(+)
MHEPQKEVFSQWQRRKVTVHQVSPVGLPGHHRTLVAAIGAAKESDRIELSSGVYHELVVVNKMVEIVAQDGATPEVSYRGTVITISSGVQCLIEDVIISQREPVSECPAVLVNDASPLIRSCTMPSIEVRGRGQPFVEQCTIAYGGGSGIAVRGSASGIFQKCSIYSHPQYCIEVDTDGQPEFIENRVWCPEIGAVPPPGGKTPTRGHGCVIISGARTGPRCAPVLRNNFLSDAGPQRAAAAPFCPTHEYRSIVDVTSLCRPVIEGNDFHGGMNGLRIRVEAAPRVAENSFRCFDRYGLYFDCDASQQSVVVKNTFHRCTVAGISLYGCFTVTENQVIGPGDGIIVHPCKDASEGGQAELEGNEIGQAQVGIKVLQGARARVLRNNVRGCHGPCILVHGDGTVEGNHVGGSAARLQGIVAHGVGNVVRIVGNTAEGLQRGAGIASLCGAAPFVAENTVEDCHEGIVIADGARGQVERNKVVLCGTGIMVQGRSRPVVFNNTVFRSTGSGIQVQGRGLGVFIGNDVELSQGDGFSCSGGSDPYVSRNVFRDCVNSGVVVCDGGRGTFARNEFTNNGQQGALVVDLGSDPVFRANIVTGKESAGLASADGALGYFEKNAVSGVRVGLTASGPQTRPLFVCNTVGPDVGTGAHCHSGAGGTLLHNSFTGSNGAGVLCSSGAVPQIRDNTITAARLGIDIEGGTPQVQGNHITACSTAALCAHGPGAQPTVRDNTMEGCPAAGALWEQHAEGVLSGNRITGSSIGIGVCGGAAPLAEENTVADADAEGINIGPGAAGTYRANITEDCGTGILVDSACSVVSITANTVRGSSWGLALRDPSIGAHGAHKKPAQKGTQSAAAPAPKALLTEAEILEAGAKVTFSGNTIIHSKSGSVLSERGGVALLERNKLGEAPVGVLCRNGGTGVFRGNRIFNNKTCCLRVTSGGCPLAFLNTMEGSPVGIEVCEGGLGIYEGNILNDCALQLSIGAGGSPLVRSSRFSNTNSDGAAVSAGGCPEFLDCEFTASRVGLRLAGDSKTTLRKCRVTANTVDGLVVSAASATLDRCTLTGNCGASVRVLDGGQVAVVDCDLTESDLAACFEQGASGRLEKCRISHNMKAGVRCEATSPAVKDCTFVEQPTALHALKGSSPTVTECLFRKCPAFAVQVDVRGALKADNCVFASNKTACKVLGSLTAANCKFGGNEVSVDSVGGTLALSASRLSSGDLQHGDPSKQLAAAGCTGVRCSSGTTGEVSECNFRELQTGVEVSGRGGGLTVVACRFLENAVGVCAQAESCPVVERNHFGRHQRCGVLAIEDAAPQVRDNDFTHAGETELRKALAAFAESGAQRLPTWTSGVLAGERGRCVLTNNRFDACLVGCSVVGGASPEITRNSFQGCVCGLLVAGAAADAAAAVTECLFKANLLSGLRVERGGAPDVRCSVFVGSSSRTTVASPLPVCAIEVCGGAGSFRHSLILRNKIGFCCSGGEPELSGLLVSGNTEHGVLCIRGGALRLRCCVFQSNGSDISATQGGEPQVSDCVLPGNSAVHIESASGIWRNCSISGRARVCGSSANPTFRQCSFSGQGIVFASGAEGNVDDSIFAGISSGHAGLEVQDAGTNPKVANCSFYGLPAAAFSCSRGGLGSLTDCTFTGGATAIEISDKGRPQLRRCRVQCVRRGVVSAPGGAGLITDSTVMMCDTGALCAKGGTTTLRNVEIYDCRQHGVHGEDGSAMTLSECSIFDNLGTGVSAAAGSKMTLYRNEISSSQEHALVKDSDSDCTFDGNKVRLHFSPIPRDKLILQERVVRRRAVEQMPQEQIGKAAKRLRRRAADAAEAIAAADHLWELWGVPRVAAAAGQHGAESEQSSSGAGSDAGSPRESVGAASAVRSSEGAASPVMPLDAGPAAMSEGREPTGCDAADAPRFSPQPPARHPRPDQPPPEPSAAARATSEKAGGFLSSFARDTQEPGADSFGSRAAAAVDVSPPQLRRSQSANPRSRRRSSAKRDDSGSKTPPVSGLVSSGVAQEGTLPPVRAPRRLSRTGRAQTSRRESAPADFNLDGLGEAPSALPRRASASGASASGAPALLRRTSRSGSRSELPGDNARRNSGVQRAGTGDGGEEQFTLRRASSRRNSTIAGRADSDLGRGSSLRQGSRRGSGLRSSTARPRSAALQAVPARGCVTPEAGTPTMPPSSAVPGSAVNPAVGGNSAALIEMLAGIATDQESISERSLVTECLSPAADPEAADVAVSVNECELPSLSGTLGTLRQSVSIVVAEPPGSAPGAAPQGALQQQLGGTLGAQRSPTPPAAPAPRSRHVRSQSVSSTAGSSPSPTMEATASAFGGSPSRPRPPTLDAGRRSPRPPSAGGGANTPPRPRQGSVPRSASGAALAVTPLSSPGPVDTG